MTIINGTNTKNNHALERKIQRAQKEEETRPKTFTAVIVVTRGDEAAEIEIPVRATSEKFAHEAMARLFRLPLLVAYENRDENPPSAALIIKES